MHTLHCIYIHTYIQHTVHSYKCTQPKHTFTLYAVFTQTYNNKKEGEIEREGMVRYK